MIRMNIENQFFEVLCRDYTTLNYVDLVNDIVQPLKIDTAANVSGMANMQTNIKVNYTEVITGYCDRYVAASFKKEFINILGRENLLKALADGRRVVYRYESIPNKAGQHYFEAQVVCINEDNFDGNVIVAFHHIDDIVALEQRYRRELEKIAYLDSLTGLENRAAFTKELLSYAGNERGACVVADVNNLKLCNDRYGHLEGDKIISDAAECMFNAFKNLGKCYRIGGMSSVC